jgi:hypothetical protein
MSEADDARLIRYYPDRTVWRVTENGGRVACRQVERTSASLR